MVSRRSIQFSFLGLVSAVVVILSFFIFKPYLNILVISGVSAVIFYPLYQRVLRAWGEKKVSLAAGFTVAVASIVIFTPLVLSGIQIFSEANTIYGNFDENASNEMGPLGNIEPSENAIIREMQEKFELAVTNFMANFRNLLDVLIANASNFFAQAANVALALFLWVLSFYYFLRDGHRIKGLLVHFSPLSDKFDREILSGLVRSIKTVVGGSLIVAVVQGVLAGIGLAVFGVPTPAIWGLVSIIAALVPTIGTALVMLPAAAYLLLTNHFGMAIGLLIYSFVAVGSIDNILRPKLMEKGIGLHPLAILLGVLGGLEFFGPVGFLTGPIILSLLVELIHVYREMTEPAVDAQ